MANYEHALNSLIDVVAHLVHVNVRWNVDMDKDLAIAKLEAARIHAATGDIESVVGDVADAVSAAKSGDIGEAITSAEAGVKDAEKVVSDVVSVVKPNG